MSKAQGFTKGFTLMAVLAVLLFFLAVGTARAQSAAVLSAPGSAGLDSATISLWASISAVVAVLLGVGAFIQRSKDSTNRLQELATKMETLSTQMTQAMQDSHDRCEVFRGAQAAALSAVKDTFATALAESTKTLGASLDKSLERMWKKYDDLSERHNSSNDRLIVLETKAGVKASRAKKS